MGLPRKLCLHQKNCLSRKTCLSRKMFYLKNLTNPKKFLRECNIYVKISNFLTSGNFGKFLRSKSMCSSISCKLEFILCIKIQKKKIWTTDILGMKTVISDLKIVGNLREILENAMLQDLPYPWKSMCTNFQLDCSKTPQKFVSPKKIISPKKCLF